MTRRRRALWLCSVVAVAVAPGVRLAAADDGGEGGTRPAPGPRHIATLAEVIERLRAGG